MPVATVVCPIGAVSGGRRVTQSATPGRDGSGSAVTSVSPCRCCSSSRRGRCCAPRPRYEPAGERGRDLAAQAAGREAIGGPSPGPGSSPIHHSPPARPESASVAAAWICVASVVGRDGGIERHLRRRRRREVDLHRREVDAVSPARSLAVPVRTRAVPSLITGRYRRRAAATPDTESLHVNVAVTGALRQPLAFAGGDSAAMIGGVRVDRSRRSRCCRRWRRRRRRASRWRARSARTGRGTAAAAAVDRHVDVAAPCPRR